MNIPFLCPQCEWDGTDLFNVDFDVFNGSYINVNLDIAFDTETMIDPPTTTRLSFVHLNVNWLDVEGWIDEIRYLFQNKPYNIIGINETKLTDDAPTDKFEMEG